MAKKISWNYLASQLSELQLPDQLAAEDRFTLHVVRKATWGNSTEGVSHFVAVLKQKQQQK